MNALILFVLLYLAVTVAIGLYATKFVVNSKDYLVAGLDARVRWMMPILVAGIIFGRRRRTTGVSFPARSLFGPDHQHFSGCGH